MLFYKKVEFHLLLIASGNNSESYQVVRTLIF